MDLPTYVQVEPTAWCNLACPMCASRYRPKHEPVDMPWSLLQRIADELPLTTTLHLQGLGEPMLHPRFFDMVRYASRRGLRVTTSTNLTLMSGRSIAACLDSGLDTLYASIDATTPLGYESIRVNASFTRVAHNLEALLQARGPRKTPRIHLVMVLMRRTWSELPALVRMASDWGVDEMFVQHLSHTPGDQPLPGQDRVWRFIDEERVTAVDADEVRAVFATARELAKDQGMPLRLPRLSPRCFAADAPGRQRCDWPWTGTYITSDGSVQPCCMVPVPGPTTLGHLDDASLAEVWHGADYDTFRERLNAGPLPPPCRECALYQGLF